MNSAHPSGSRPGAGPGSGRGDGRDSATTAATGAPTTAAAYVPAGAPIPALAAAVADCRGCGLADLPGTRAVFGEGPPTARLALVGEQPGDVEDRRGRPFVGPAGKLLDQALEQAGIAREQVWVTNAVKHFRYRTGDGPRRIHQTPDAAHVTACRPWLQAELNRIRPAIVVLLGATAGQSLLGPSFRVTKMRGRLLDGPRGSGARLLGTLHPSAILRTPPDARDEAFAAFVRDLAVAADALGQDNAKS